MYLFQMKINVFVHANDCLLDSLVFLRSIQLYFRHIQDENTLNNIQKQYSDAEGIYQSGKRQLKKHG